MKKLLALALALLMTAGVLCGCTTGAPSAAPVSTPAGTANPTPEPVPTKGEPVTVTWFWNEGNVELPEDSWVCKKILEDINIKYVPISPKGTDFEERLQLLLASQDVPDLMESYTTLTVNLKKWGVCVPVEQYLVPEKLPNYFRIQKNIDKVLSYLPFPDGHIYEIPNCSVYNIGTSCYIRYDWLKNLNLDVPKNMDELKNVLVQFVKNDPDRNNVADTIGFASNEVWGLFDMAGEWGAKPDGWYKDGSGGVALGMFAPNQKQFLAYVKSLVDSGAMDMEVATLKFDQVNQMIQAGKVGFQWNWNDPSAVEEMRKVQPDADWRPMPVPQGVYDKGYMFVGGLWDRAYCLSSRCQNVDSVLKLINYMCDDKSTADSFDFTGSYWVSYGEKGVNWNVTAEGILDTGSIDAAIKERNKADTWAGKCARFRSQFGGLAWMESLKPEYKEYNKLLATYPTQYDIPQSDPNVAIDTVGVIPSDSISAFVNEWAYTKYFEFFYQVILGKVDLEAGYADFLAQAKAAGIDQINTDMLKLLQDAKKLN